MMVAGIDIGNSTTECCISKTDIHGNLEFLAAAETETTGLKGTIDNIKGIEAVLEKSMNQLSMDLTQLDLIRINEAAPVVGDTAMETITETIISDSTLLGHNPSTPAGEGLAVGVLYHIEELPHIKKDDPSIIVVPGSYSYQQVAIALNTTKANIVGVILQLDEAVLVYNRLTKKVPVIDEVTKIGDIPMHRLAVIEVSQLGKSVTTISNPYGLAKVFGLSHKETKQVIPVAKSLIGKKSGVVVYNQEGGIKETFIKAGHLHFIEEDNETVTVGIDEGSEAIMNKLSIIESLKDVKADSGTYIDAMITRMKNTLSSLIHEDRDHIQIKDLLAIDTMIPVKVKGALAGEVALEKAVAIAAMVKADYLPMEKLAKKLQENLNIQVHVAGVEAVMAAIGALTTKGTTLPIAVLDLGGGSTDGAILYPNGLVHSTHLAGAGSFATMLINKELHLENEVLAELIKRYPLGKVESLYQITMENGEVIFFKEPLNPKLYAKVVIIKEDEYIPIPYDLPLDIIATTRKAIKEKIFVKNALRALTEVAPKGNIRKISNVVLVGGSALDFEIPEMIQKELANYNIVAGRADIQGEYGPRNAVATGLCMSFVNEVSS